MKGWRTWQIIANACNAAVLVLCIFTSDQYKKRTVDMIIIASITFGVLNKLDDINDKLNERL